MQNFLLYFLTKDWFLEYMRERLTEVYDREVVDKLMPFSKEHYFQMPGMETISDDELKKIGLFVENGAHSLLKTDESLLHIREKKGSLNTTAVLNDGNEYTYEVHSRNEGGGSNCWAVHGKLTKSGQPMLACDPHLAKMMSGLIYATRLTWNYEHDGKVKRTFNAGGSNVGIPLFTYSASPICASGVTSLNPDTLDLFVDEVKGDTFLASDGAWKQMTIIEETIKVRFGSSVSHKIRFTDNGVVLPRDLLEGKA